MQFPWLQKTKEEQTLRFKSQNAKSQVLLQKSQKKRQKIAQRIAEKIAVIFGSWNKNRSVSAVSNRSVFGTLRKQKKTPRNGSLGLGVCSSAGTTQPQQTPKPLKPLKEGWEVTKANQSKGRCMSMWAIVSSPSKFGKMARKTTKRARIVYPCRTPKIPGQEGENAQKEQGILAGEQN